MLVVYSYVHFIISKTYEDGDFHHKTNETYISANIYHTQFWIPVRQ